MPNQLTPDQQQVVRDYNEGYHLGYTDQIRIEPTNAHPATYWRGLEQGWEDRLEDQELITIGRNDFDSLTAEEQWYLDSISDLIDKI